MTDAEIKRQTEELAERLAGEWMAGDTTTLEQLLADKARLDWLEEEAPDNIWQQQGMIWTIGDLFDVEDGIRFTGKTLRFAIDRAMNQSPARELGEKG